MALQTEHAEINLKVNKGAADLSLTELNAKVKALTDSLANMHKADNPQLYERRRDALYAAKAARDAEKESIDNGAAALRDFQKAFADSLKDAQAATTNNPVKKFSLEARSAFAELNNTVQKSPLKQSLSNIKTSLSSSVNSSPFFAYIVNGYNAVSTAVNNHKSKLQLQKAALAENKAAQEAITLAMAENKAAQEAVNAALVANKLVQEESAAAVAAATTMEEAKTAAIANEKAIEEEAILTTKANKLAQEEATIATEAQTVAQEAANIATTEGSGAMNVFKIALASTGIGLLLVALGSLVAYFTETNEGARKFKVLTAELNAVFQECMKIIAPLGKAIMEAFMDPEGGLKVFIGLLDISLIPLRTLLSVLNDIKHGQFGQAFKDVAHGVADYAKDVTNVTLGTIKLAQDLKDKLGEASEEIKKQNLDFAGSIKTAKEMAEARNQLTIKEREWSGEKLKQQGEVALLTKKLRDQNLSEAERIQLAEKAKKIREQIFQGDLAMAKANEALVDKEQSLNSKKDLDAIQSAKNRVQEVINAYNSQEQNIDNRESMLQKKQTTKEESAKTTFNKLTALTAEFNAKDLAAQQNKNEKEIAAEAAKYDALIQKEKDFLSKKGATQAQKAAIKDRIAQQEKAKQDAINAIRERQEKDISDKIKKFNEGLTDIRATELQKQQDTINEFYDNLAKAEGDSKTIELARKQALDEAKLQEEERLQDEMMQIQEEGETTEEERQTRKLVKIAQHYDAEVEALYKKYSKEIQATQWFHDAIAAIEANKNKALGTADKEDPKLKKEEEDRKKRIDLEVRAGETIASSLFSISQNNRKADLDAKIKSLEDQKAVELSNTNLTQTQKQAINDKYAKLEADAKLKAWQADKEAQAIQVLINGAVAAIKTYAEYGFTPAGVAADIALGAQVVGQEAVILSQKPPQFGDGGIPDGPSHDDGGLNLVDEYGRVHGQIEGGEPVISRKAYAANKTVVDALLNSGGRRLNMDKVQQAVVSSSTRGATSLANTNTSSGSHNNVANSDRLDKIERLIHDHIAMQAKINAIPVHFYQTQYELFTARNAVIRNDATL